MVTTVGDVCGGLISFFLLFFFMLSPFIFTLSFFVVFVGIIALFIYLLVKSASGGGLGFGSSGARTDLDSVEAGVVLGTNPLRLLGSIVMGLVRKGDLKVKSAKPLRVEVIERRDDTHCPACGAPVSPEDSDAKCDYCGSPIAKAAELTYYEQAFLNHAISTDGALDEAGSNGVIRLLEDQVEAKMRSHSAEATRAHYQQQLKGMWEELGGAPDDAKAYDFSKNSGWLALDEQFDEKTTRYIEDKDILRLVKAFDETIEKSGLDESKFGLRTGVNVSFSVKKSIKIE